MTDADAIRSLIATRNAALGSGDAMAFVAHLSDDIVSYDLQPPLSLAGPAARDVAGIEAWLATWDGPIEVSLVEPVIRIGGNLAVAHGLSRMAGTKLGEPPSLLWFRTTLVLERRDPGWTIVHEHHSLPMKMDGSGLAAVDLTPADSLTSGA